MQSKSFFEVLEDQLRKDLRSEIEAEIRAQMSKSSDQQDKNQAFRAQAASGRVETWLASHLGKTVFTRNHDARKAYGSATQSKNQRTEHSFTSAEQNPSHLHTKQTEEPRATIAGAESPQACETLEVRLKSSEDLIALEFLRRHSDVKLSETLTHKALKTAWRKAALKTHPDRFVSEDAVTQARMKALFQEICSAFERLEKHFEAHAQAAA